MLIVSAAELSTSPLVSLYLDSEVGCAVLFSVKEDLLYLLAWIGFLELRQKKQLLELYHLVVVAMVKDKELLAEAVHIRNNTLAAALFKLYALVVRIVGESFHEVYCHERSVGDIVDKHLILGLMIVCRVENYAVIAALRALPHKKLTASDKLFELGIV